MCLRAGITRLLVIGAICLVTAFLYRDTASIYFLGDDLGFLYHVANGVRNECSLSQLSDEFISPPHRGGFFYRPLTVLSFLGDYLLYGANPSGWHFTSLLLHLVNVVLLWRLGELLARGWSGRGATLMGGAAAAVFALRPSGPETVVWLSGRNDELVLIGFLVALLAYLRAEGRWEGYYLLALGGFLFALGSKEAGVTLPGALLALHFAGILPVTPVGETPYRRAWLLHVLKGIGPFALILLIYFIGRILLFGTPFKVYQEVMPIDVSNPAWWTVKLHALRIFLAPSVKMGPLAVSFLIAGFIQILIGLVISLRRLEVRRIWVFGGCWLIAALLPLAQHLRVAPMGEGVRLLYIPGAALAVVLAAPLVTCFKGSGGGNVLCRTFAFAGIIGITLLAFLSILLFKDFFRPWVDAGRSMRSLVAAIAVRADAVPQGGFAVLLVPDHFDGALFARNGQGALMDWPVQKQSLQDRVVILTPPTLGQHAARMASLFRQNRGVEHWGWNLETRSFERLRLREHNPDTWVDAWGLVLRHSGCWTLVDEFVMLYHH